ELEGVITSDELLALKVLPKRLIVVGGGVIGLEFASIYKELGSEVVVLASRILKNADAEISKRLAPMLKKQGIELYNDVRAKKIEKKGDMLLVEAAYKKDGKTFEVEGDYVLIASGRGPVYDGLPLTELGIAHDEKGIVVDDGFETDVKGIYAIGDIVRGNPQLAHVASAQAEYVAERIMGHQSNINLEVYPNCVFTLNEVAHAGYTEEELKEKGVAYKASKFNFAANGKALCLGDANGLVKMLSAEDGTLLGAHIIGPHANDLIAECTLAIANRMKADDLLRAVHAHPTLTEAVMEATAGLLGTAIHIAKPRK
ncbi:MAG: FAD-dependent oxidoreductase, partial [Bacillota bacterium]|nr:FAD-dependent oxidoreductase [Bacillota bacterium]